MALSETQAGSSLLEIATTATPSGNNPGEYNIKGSKMWTSGADHGLYDNIIHMLLAKTESGISLFLVPKNLVNDDGSLGARNDYVINGVNHKMGCRGLSNCYWSLGDESGGATGYLIGEEGKGLNCMFFMMNEMRIHVGIGAAVCGMRGYLESLAYACDRKQGRKKPNPSPVPIIEHNDVKRMLLQQKAYSEGAMMLCLFAASLNSSADPSDRLLLEVLIPLVKSWPSEWCLEANKWAIQGEERQRAKREGWGAKSGGSDRDESAWNLALRSLAPLHLGGLGAAVQIFTISNVYMLCSSQS